MEHLTSEDAVILVYQDTLTCGPCSVELTDVVEFMEHKAEHCLAPNIFKCELCRLIFDQQRGLVQHYRTTHALPKFGAQLLQEIARNNALVLGAKGSVSVEGSASALGSTSALGSQSTQESERISSSTETANLRTPNLKVTSRGNSNHPDKNGAKSDTMKYDINLTAGDGVFYATAQLPQTDTINSGGERTEDPSFGGADTKNSRDKIVTCHFGDKISKNTICAKTAQISEHSDDFLFILKNVPTTGRSLSYAKVWLHCFHCAFRTQARMTLMKHMHSAHEELIGIQATVDMKGIEEHSNQENTRILKMSSYNKLYTTKPLTTTRKKSGKTARKRNIEKQDLPGTFTCPTCDKEFGRLRYLRKHMATHLTERKYLCDECGKGFTTKTYLTHHRKIHTEKLFSCAVCDFQSKITTAIHAHRQVHPQNSVLCDDCGTAYSDRSALTKHKRVHDPSRPFGCTHPGCTWRFNTEVMCKAHVRAHTSVGKFTCSVCGHVFRHKHHLQRHELRLHGSIITKTGNNSAQTQVVFEECDIQPNTVNLVIDTEDGEISEAQHLVVTTAGEHTLGRQHLVVTTDNDGAIGERHLVVTEGADETLGGKHLVVRSVADQTFS